MIIFFSLSACTSVEIDDPKRTSIELEIPSPLKLETVEWTTIKQNDTTFVALDLPNFESFERNNALIQGRLELYHVTLEQYKAYYKP